MPDTSFTNSYILTDALLEAAIGADPRTAAIALKAAAAATQEWYCQAATKIIDSLNYSGYKLLSTQARAFPRKYQISDDETYPYGDVNILIDTYGYGYISTDPPQPILDACVEEAIAIYNFYSTITNTTRQDLQNQGVTSFTIGKLSETYGVSKIGTVTQGLRSLDAYNLIEPYLENSMFII